jgi:hypothetical protein
METVGGLHLAVPSLPSQDSVRNEDICFINPPLASDPNTFRQMGSTSGGGGRFQESSEDAI